MMSSLVENIPLSLRSLTPFHSTQPPKPHIRLSRISSAALRNLTSTQILHQLEQIPDPHQMYLKSDVIVDWLVRCRPPQTALHEVFSEILPGYLNDTLYMFLCDVLRAQGYILPRTPRVSPPSCETRGSPPGQSLTRGSLPGQSLTRGLFYDSDMIKLSPAHIREFARRHTCTMTYGIKCPVVLCPCFNKRTHAQFHLGTNTGTLLQHSDQRIHHDIMYWYFGILINSKWKFVSLLRNAPKAIASALECAEEVWLGFLVRDKGVLDFTEYWQKYPAERLLAIRHCDDLVSYHGWFDVLTSWIIYNKPDRDLLDQIWTKIDFSKLNIEYIKTATESLNNAGYQSPDLDVHATSQFIHALWTQLSPDQTQDLLSDGSTTLTCVKCPIASCTESSECSLLLSVDGSCVHGVFSHPDVRHIVWHVYGAVKIHWYNKPSFFSLYTLDRGFSELLNYARSIWIGVLVSQ